MRKNLLPVFILCFLTVSFAPLVFSQPLAVGHAKFLGCANDGPIESTFDMYWNQMTPGNAGKWGSVEPGRDSYNWGPLDVQYNYAKERGIPFKMHTLIWGAQQPAWISNLDSAQKVEEIEEWIKLVGERYPDLDQVDVVNEPIASHNPPDGLNGRANYKNALGGNGTTGWDWVIWSFQKARQYIPQAELILNDYGIINSNSATDTYLQIINLLKDRGIIDGIGVQGHRFEFESADTTVLKNNMTKLGATGLPLYITEFDLGNILNSGTPNDSVQLALYKKIFPVLWRHSAVKGITLWGYVSTDMWQTTAYLIRPDGSERPAMVWLRDFLTLQGRYRTRQSGNWNDVSSWERYNGTTWVSPAASIPTINESIVSIQSGHTVTVTESDSIDQLVINANATLAIPAGVTLLVKNGDGIDLSSRGTIRNFGALAHQDSATLKLFSGSVYSHQQDGGTIPTIEWGVGSTIEFDSIKASAPFNANQNFYNILWNCPAQAGEINLGWDGNTIAGNITIVNTDAGRLQMCAPAAGDSAVVNILGNIIQSGGQFTTHGTSNGNTAITINHYGNINVTGGNFSICKGTQEGTGATTWNFMGSNFNISNAVTENANPTGAAFVFSGKGVQTLTLGTGNTLTALPIKVARGSTLNAGASVLTGSGNFTVDSGATLIVTHMGGLDSAIQTTGAITLSKASNYVYSGTSAQATGSLLPDTVSNLVINNTAGVTLSDTVTINGILELQKGALLLGGNRFYYGIESSLKYSGAAAQTTTDVELPEGGEPKNLVIANPAGVTLHASRAFKGSVEVGGRLTLGSNSLTAANATSTSTQRYIVTGAAGVLKLTSVGSSSESLFPVGTNFYAPVWVKNTGAQDTISVNVVADTNSAPYGGRVRVKWNITENTAGGGNYTLTFGWMGPLENTAFRTPDRNHNAHIFFLGDTSVAGSGDYALQFATQPYTSSRGGITTLGEFAVGRFKDVPDILGIDQQEAFTPNKFTLYQNYPNPFNPTTTIRFSLPVRSDVRIVVSNMLGQIVKEITAENYDAGVHQVTFNGYALASGVYFYRMETSTGFVQTKKFMLLK